MSGERPKRTRKAIPTKRVIDWEQFEPDVCYEFIVSSHFPSFSCGKVKAHSNAKKRGLRASTWSDQAADRMWVIFRSKQDNDSK